MPHRLTNSHPHNVTTEHQQRWQHVVNSLAQIFDAPIAQILRIQNNHVEVFLENANPGVSSFLGIKFSFDHSFLKPEAFEQSGPFYIPDISKDMERAANPLFRDEISSYLGSPLRWPDGGLFGVLCVLDQKPIGSTMLRLSLLDSFRTILEDELHLVQEINERKRYQRLLEGKMAELTSFNTELGRKERRILELKREMEKMQGV